jgi:hypothetical protein
MAATSVHAKYILLRRSSWHGAPGSRSLNSLAAPRLRCPDATFPSTPNHPGLLRIGRAPTTSRRDYLALIEQKINALDQAAPLAGWRLPEEFNAAASP